MREILTGVADLLFPPLCITCGTVLRERPRLPFCPPCAEGIHLIRSPLCPRCGVPFPAGNGEDHLCGECLTGERPYAIARSLGLYEGTLLKAIHLFKYRGRIGIGEILGKMMADFAGGQWDMDVFSVVIPVPLHRKRLRERGFNQALILAREVAKRFSLPLEFMALSREVFTAPQVGLGRAERSKNVRKAFAVRKPDAIAGRRILLVDDVTTTGSTVSECAAVLKREDAETVAVLTLARALDDADVAPSAAPPSGEVQ
ncbi:MAG: double zinc ribbon domain-containing protein [Syntrophales bacterium]